MRLNRYLTGGGTAHDEVIFFVEGIWNNIRACSHVDRNYIDDLEFKEKVIKWDLYRQQKGG